MKLLLQSCRNKRGFTIIEAIIYVILFSSLIVTYIPYAYNINEKNAQLVEAIIESSS